MVKQPEFTKTGIEQWFTRRSVDHATSFSGSSPTVISFGDIKNVTGCAGLKHLPVVIKCYSENVESSDRPRLEGLRYESRVYACVVANMTTVPFFAFPYAIFSKRPALTDKLEMKVAKYLRRISRPESGKGITHNGVKNRGVLSPVNYIVMEDCGNLTLEHTVKHCTGSTFIQLTLQMLSALKVMQENEITNNDMHWKNVLVQKGAPSFFMDMKSGQVLSGNTSIHPANLGYTNYDCARVDAGNLVKIFDWDAAVVHRLSENTYTHEHGLHTNVFKKMFDTIGFLKKWKHAIWKYPGRNTAEHSHLNQKFRKLFHVCFGRLEQEYPWAFRDGKGGPYFQATCYPVDDESLKNPHTTMEYEDDCWNTWPQDLDEDFEPAVTAFTSLLGELLPKTNRFRSGP